MSVLNEVRARLQDWWIDHVWADTLAVFALVGAHFVLVARTDRFDVLSWITAQDRRGVYAAAAVVVSLTGALSGVAVSQLSSAKGERAIALKKQVGTELASNWRSVYKGAMVSAMLAILALILDGTNNPPVEGHNSAVAIWIFEFGLLLGFSKFFRLTALFHPLIVASVRDDVEGPEDKPAPAPVVNTERFLKRVSGE